MTDKATDFTIWKSVFYAALEGTVACSDGADVIVQRAKEIAATAMRAVEAESAESMKEGE